jgi:hypothetical protein
MVATPHTPLKPLSAGERLLLPLARAFSAPARREQLDRRATLTRRRAQQRKASRDLEKLLAREARQYAQILQAALTRLGEAHFPRSDRDEKISGGARKGKIAPVKFEYIYTSAEIIYFKILTRRKTLWGFKNALPYRVRVIDLIHEDTLRELSYACERVVTAVYDDPRKGAWLRVHRLEGVGGLPTRVTFEQMLEHYPANMSQGTIILGIGEHRKVQSVDLATHPHALIAGSTGSGKSNIVNHLISSLMVFTDPAELKFVLIDLKRLEFTHYKKSAHLFRPDGNEANNPIVVTPEDALTTLAAMVDEIHRRAELFEDRAKELAEWNELYPDQALPRIVTVIDEFAELMLASGRDVAKEADQLVHRIANLGRAAGIHLWICTQRPATNVVSNGIKINMPLVIAGRTQNKAQSAVIVGNGDAADLPLIPGRMLYQSGSRQWTLQTPYITREDIRWAVSISRGRGAGVITMNGTDPQIVKSTLIEFLANAGGSLALRMVDDLLKDYGITRAMFKAFQAEIIKQNEVTTNGQVYEVRRKGQTYHLIAAPLEDAAPVDQSPEANDVGESAPTPEINLLPEPPATPNDGETELSDEAEKMQAALIALRAIRKQKFVQAIEKESRLA